MTVEQEVGALPEGCPACGALPCDWVNNPFTSAPSVSDKPLMRDAAVVPRMRVSQWLERVGSASAIEVLRMLGVVERDCEACLWSQGDHQQGACPAGEPSFPPCPGFTTPTPVEKPLLADLLTKAVGDITAALIMADKEASVEAWTAPYVEAINRADDATPVEEPAKGEVAYMCEADVRALQGKPEGDDLSISPVPRPDLGMNMALYATPPLANPIVSVSDEQVEAEQTIRDALLDSQYLAGAKAGWNAAQSDDPEAAFVRLCASREGHLAGYREAKAALQAQPNGDAKVEERAAEALAQFARSRFADTRETRWDTMGEERRQYFRDAVACVHTALNGTKP